MAYGWIITKDFIFDVKTESSSIGVTGPSGLSDKLQEKLDAGEGETFRLYDDDHNLYYEGRILHERSGFEPLDDYGTGNAGCTGIKYLQPNGEWEYL